LRAGSFCFGSIRFVVKLRLSNREAIAVFGVGGVGSNRGLFYI
jgi:hypothetical protein